MDSLLARELELQQDCQPCRRAFWAGCWAGGEAAPHHPQRLGPEVQGWSPAPSWWELLPTAHLLPSQVLVCTIAGSQAETEWSGVGGCPLPQILSPSGPQGPVKSPSMSQIQPSPPPPPQASKMLFSSPSGLQDPAHHLSNLSPPSMQLQLRSDQLSPLFRNHP